MPGRDRTAKEIDAVVPVVILGASTHSLVGPATIVANGERMLAVTSAELLRPHQGKQLALLTKLDGSAHIPIASWGMGRYTGIGLVELGGKIPPGHDVTPLPIGAVCATSDTRGAPSAFVTIVATPKGFARELIPVHVDNDDGGGMSDTVQRLASPLEPIHSMTSAEGAPLFAWFPPDPVLGRRSEVLAMGMGYPYRANTAKPRDLPVMAEIFGLDDLGRALISMPEPDERPELKQVVTGEIGERSKPK